MSLPAPVLEVLGLPGLVWLALAAGLAGLVRGFAGFGSALVFMPVAGALLAPPRAVMVVVLLDLIGPLVNLPGAWRNGSPREVGLLALGLVPGLMIGLVALFSLPPEAFRWAVSVISLATVAALVAGWRWRGGRGPRATLGVGFVSGLFGGAAALPGPPVVLYYMASPLPVAQVRANLTMFMLAVDLAMLVLLGAAGQLDLQIVILGLLLLIPYSLANAVGSALFHPDRARVYRALSWSLIAASALAGLPLWSRI